MIQIILRRGVLMKKNIIIIVAILSIFNLVFGNESEKVIKVIGKSEIIKEADSAHITFLVQAENRELKKAVLEANQTIDLIINSLFPLGVKREDITSSQFSTSSNGSFIFTKDKYNVTINNKVVFDDFDLIDDVILELSEKGIEEIDPITYNITNHDEIKQLARVQAIRAARSEAETIASELDLTLVGIESIKELYISDPNIDLNIKYMTGGLTAEYGRGSKAYTAENHKYSAKIKVIAEYEIVYEFVNKENTF
jgi:uncharacterized protein YggE